MAYMLYLKKHNLKVGITYNKSTMVIDRIIIIVSVNPCLDNNGNCSHLCLLSSSDTDGFGCECPNGMFLGRDRRTCSLGLFI